METYFVKKKSNRFVCKPFLKYVRSKPCCAPGCTGVSSASHLISKKWATGSDALAVPACIINGHHVQSTKTSVEILEKAGVDLQKLHRTLWFDFLKENSIPREIAVIVKTANFEFAQNAFEDLCREYIM